MVAGDIVKAVDPYTEADPVRTLPHPGRVRNIVGRAPGFLVESTTTSQSLASWWVLRPSGGKGQAWSTPRKMFRELDEEWVKPVGGGAIHG